MLNKIGSNFLEIITTNFVKTMFENVGILIKLVFIIF